MDWVSELFFFFGGGGGYDEQGRQKASGYKALLQSVKHTTHFYMGTNLERLWANRVLKEVKLIFVKYLFIKY